MSEQSDSGRVSMLARRIAEQHSTADAERWQDALARQVAEHLTLGRSEILHQALETLVRAYDRAAEPDERRLAGAAIEQLVSVIEFHATTREILRPVQGGMSPKRFTAHLFAIPVCLIRGGGPGLMFQDVGEVASARDYLRAIEASMLDAIGVSPDRPAMLRLLEHVYTPREIEAIGWVAARRLIFHALSHFSGVTVPIRDLGEREASGQIAECAQVHYLVGVYICEGEGAEFRRDGQVLARLRSWASHYWGAVAAYTTLAGVGQFDRVLVGLPSGLFSAVRQGLASASRLCFELELERVVRQTMGDLMAAVEVVRGDDELRFEVMLGEPREGFWGQKWDIGRVIRKAHPFESPEEVLEDIAACLMKIGVRRIEVMQTGGDVLRSSRDVEDGQSRLH